MDLSKYVPAALFLATARFGSLYLKAILSWRHAWFLASMYILLRRSLYVRTIVAALQSLEGLRICRHPCRKIRNTNLEEQNRI